MLEKLKKHLIAIHPPAKRPFALECTADAIIRVWKIYKPGSIEL